MTSNYKKDSAKHVLLLVLPFWDPLIPPQGISHLKSALIKNNYSVHTNDANTKEDFKLFYNKYFRILSKWIPDNKKGNFYNIGHDVLRNHLMAHLNMQNEDDYLELVRDIIYKTFYTKLNDGVLIEFKKIISKFFYDLDHYVEVLLNHYNPDYVGISVLRDTLASSVAVFNKVKKFNSNIKTFMGGSIFLDQLSPNNPNFEIFLNRVQSVDKIVIGKGQNLMLKILNDIDSDQRVYKFENLPEHIKNDDSTDFPDLSDFDVTKEYPYIAAQASYGCPNLCSFCNVKSFSGRYRERSIAKVVSEMIKLSKKYNNKLFFMNDALLNRIASNLTNEILKLDAHLYWDGYLRVSKEVCDYNNTIYWRKGGFYRARLGVESGSQHVLDLMHKDITPEQTLKSLKSLSNAGIKTTTYWVIGHPDESDEDFQMTLDLLTEAKDYIYEAECNPFIYSYDGQNNTVKWENSRELLYKDEIKNTLLIKTWIYKGYPSRELIYNRVNQFVQKCNDLNIPNPYSIVEIYKADQRWKNLHKNSVPSIIEIKDNLYQINEAKNVKNYQFISAKEIDFGEFDF